MRKKLLLGLATGAVAAAALAGAAFAQGGGTSSSTSPRDTLLDKLAQKLGIERSKLDDALKSANADVRTEELDARLAQLVTDGKLTQAQSDEIKAWLKARPVSLDSILPGDGLMGGMHGRGMGGFEFGGGPGGPALGFGLMADSAKLDAALAKLVTAGTLTQAQSDEIKAWLKARPAILDTLIPKAMLHEGHGSGGFGRGHGHGQQQSGASGFRFMPYGGQDSSVPQPSVLQSGTNS